MYGDVFRIGMKFLAVYKETSKISLLIWNLTLKIKSAISLEPSYNSRSSALITYFDKHVRIKSWSGNALPAIKKARKC